MTYHDIFCLGQISKEFIIKTRHIAIRKRNEFLREYPPFLHSYLKHSSFVVFDSKWLGNTDYIDQITSKHVTKDVSIGVDCYERRFAVFRKMGSVCCVFQRYSDTNSRWTTGSLDSIPGLTGGMNARSDEFEDAFSVWFTKE